MTDDELRALVREAVARELAGRATRVPAPAAPPAVVASMAVVRQHASHAMFVLGDGADGDGPCLVEPAVPCTHCGFCRSYGH